MKNFKGFINEAVRKNTLQWLRKSIADSEELESLSLAMGEIKVSKKDVEVVVKMYSNNTHYGDTFRIKPVNSPIGITVGSLKVLYKGVEIFNYPKPIMVVGDIVANTSNNSLAGITVGRTRSGEDFGKSTIPVYFGNPGSREIHKIYSNQVNYENKEISRSNTYYDTAKLTPAGYKKAISAAKKSLDMNLFLINITNEIEERIGNGKYDFLKPTKTKPEKVAPVKKVKKEVDPISVGNDIETKNDSEFYAVIRKVQGSKVTVEYSIDGGYDYKTATISKSMIDIGDGYLSLPNWTLT